MDVLVTTITIGHLIKLLKDTRQTMTNKKITDEFRIKIMPEIIEDPLACEILDISINTSKQILEKYMIITLKNIVENIFLFIPIYQVDILFHRWAEEFKSSELSFEEEIILSEILKILVCYFAETFFFCQKYQDTLSKTLKNFYHNDVNLFRTKMDHITENFSQENRNFIMKFFDNLAN